MYIADEGFFIKFRDFCFDQINAVTFGDFLCVVDVAIETCGGVIAGCCIVAYRNVAFTNGCARYLFDIALGIFPTIAVANGRAFTAATLALMPISASR